MSRTAGRAMRNVQVDARAEEVLGVNSAGGPFAGRPLVVDTELDEAHDRPIAVAHVRGDLDRFTAEFLRQRLMDSVLVGAPPRVVLDLEQVRFCDTDGIQPLIAVWKAVRARDGVLVVASSSYQFHRILRRLTLDEHIATSPTLERAIALVVRAGLETP